MRPTLVFDLDGTLADTVPDLAACLNRLLAARELDPFSDRQIAAMVGDGAAALVTRAMAARDRSAGRPDIDAFLRDYESHATDRSALFPGVADTLAVLRADAWRLAVCTNKPERPARSLLEHLGIADRFDALCGGDSVPSRKPDPAHPLAAVAQAGGDPAAAIMVGDHRNDVAAASAAGIPAIFARWGYGAPAMAAGAAAEADAPADLPALAARLLTASPGTSPRPRTSASGS